MLKTYFKKGKKVKLLRSPAVAHSMPAQLIDADDQVTRICRVGHPHPG